MMRDVLIVAKAELRLFLRGRSVWITAPLVVLLGAWQASQVREYPTGALVQYAAMCTLVTLLLALNTGDQIIRDRERRLDGALLSTPITTRAYIWGKYLAALASLLVLGALNLLGSIVVDQFDPWRDPPFLLGHVRYPPLGAWPYLSLWLLLLVPALCFGAAFTFTAITLLRGQRVVAYSGALILWIGPLLGGGSWPLMLDVGGSNVYFRLHSVDLILARYQTMLLSQRTDASGLMALVQANTPPPDLPPEFFLSRALFLALAVALVVGATWIVGRQRRGHV